MIFLLPIDYILQRYKFFFFLVLIFTKYSPNTKFKEAIEDLNYLMLSSGVINFT